MKSRMGERFPPDSINMSIESSKTGAYAVKTLVARTDLAGSRQSTGLVDSVYFPDLRSRGVCEFDFLSPGFGGRSK